MHMNFGIRAALSEVDGLYYVNIVYHLWEADQHLGCKEVPIGKMRIQPPGEQSNLNLFIVAALRTIVAHLDVKYLNENAPTPVLLMENIRDHQQNLRVAADR